MIGAEVGRNVGGCRVVGPTADFNLKCITGKHFTQIGIREAVTYFPFLHPTSKVHLHSFSHSSYVSKIMKKSKLGLT
jgi:hypothetical protein